MLSLKVFGEDFVYRLRMNEKKEMKRKKYEKKNNSCSEIRAMTVVSHANHV